jgi:NADH-quinone oxidoreductase subunit J
MTIYSIIFYVLAGLILVSTGLAITRRNLVHAVVYLVISFFGSAMLFYLFGAPLLAAFEVIIYAGAIMVLFLFVIMMIKVEGLEENFFPVRQWVPAAAMGIVLTAVGILMLAENGSQWAPLKAATGEPLAFALYLFQQHWLSIEVVSLLLLVALIGVVYLGKHGPKNMTTPDTPRD